MTGKVTIRCDAMSCETYVGLDIWIYASCRERTAHSWNFWILLKLFSISCMLQRFLSYSRLIWKNLTNVRMQEFFITYLLKYFLFYLFFTDQSKQEVVRIIINIRECIYHVIVKSLLWLNYLCMDKRNESSTTMKYFRQRDRTVGTLNYTYSKNNVCLYRVNYYK